MLNQAHSARWGPLNVALRGLPVRIMPGQIVVTTTPSLANSARMAGQPNEGEFAHCVGRQKRPGDYAADRGDVDNAPSPRWRISGMTASIV